MELATAMKDSPGKTVESASVPTTAVVMVSVSMASASAQLATVEKTAVSSPA